MPKKQDKESPYKSRESERAAKWNLVNRERHLEHQRKYRAANRERLNQKTDEQREAKRVYDKAYNAKNKAKKAQQTKAWRLAHPELVAVYKRRWVEKNPVEMLLMRHARRAKTAGGRISKKDISNWDSRECGVCEIVIDGKFHIDHIIPLSRGGEHVVENLQLTHPSCNLKKHNRLPSELQGAY